MRTGWPKIALALLALTGAQPAGAQAVGKPSVHLGVASCAGDNCHGAVQRSKMSHVAQDEYLIWAHKDKHSQAFAKLSGELGRQIARNLGLGDPQHAPICLECHADNVDRGRRGPQFRLADGVGCESCHGGASGWLGVHISGSGHAADLAAGLYPLEQPVARAERCLACHLGDESRFITHRIMGAGHPPLYFELDTYSAIQPAHYRVDQSYIERKGRPDDIQIWAVGQALDTRRRMQQILDAKNAPAGLQPELSLFDCEACHHPMSSLQWRARASTGLPPGHLRLYDATAMMLQVVADRIAPDQASALRTHLRGLQQATGVGWAAVREQAQAVERLADQLVRIIAGHRFGGGDAVALAKGVAALGAGDLDYSAAQQQTMALGSILAAMKLQGFADDAEIGALNTVLRSLYDAVASDRDYRPDSFAAALRQFAAKLPP